MAKARPTAAPAPGLAAARAARLCRLLRLLGERGQTRAALLRRLKVDVRSFYRDVEWLQNQLGVVIELQKDRYVLQSGAEEAIQRLPFPDPHLTLGEVQQLSRGRNAVHRKLQALLSEIVPK